LDNGHKRHWYFLSVRTWHLWKISAEQVEDGCKIELKSSCEDRSLCLAMPTITATQPSEPVCRTLTYARSRDFSLVAANL